MELNLKLPVEPLAVQSARFCRQGKFIRSYQPEKVTSYKENLKKLALSQLPECFELYKDAIGVATVFVFPCPKSFSRKKMEFIREGGIIYKTTRPDLSDNLHKALNDAMTGILWKDDSLIAVSSSMKIYGIEPAVLMRIFTL